MSNVTPIIKRVTMQISVQKVKKIVAVSAASTSMTEKTEELERVPCIQYPVTFENQTEALLDSKSEVNTMSQAFA